VNHHYVVNYLYFDWEWHQVKKQQVYCRQNKYTNTVDLIKVVSNCNQGQTRKHTIVLLGMYV